MIRLILRSLACYWRAHLGVFGGTMLASAVLTGALLVGDSITYSLRTFAMQRLGSIHYAIDSRSQLLAEALAPRLERAAGIPAVPALQLPGMAIAQPAPGAQASQVNNVQVLGVEDRFWEFGGGAPLALEPYETALNSKLALALALQEGDSVSLRVARPALMARDAPLSARDDERSVRHRYTVRRVLTDEEMGRFGLSPSQSAPHNAFVSLPFLQTQLEKEGKANLFLLGEAPAGVSIEQTLRDAWRLEDLGLSLRTCSDGVVQLESDRIFLNDETVNAAASLPGAQGTLTYLATSLSLGEKLTPYFFVVAGAMREVGDDQIIINRWMADELGAEPGDVLTLAYTQLLPSNTFEDASRQFTVSGIVEMESLAAEKERMPVFPGLSDVESCSEWDVGMPMDEDLLNDPANEAYWDTWRETPKAFVSLKAGQEMWANRFGSLTAVRFPAGASVTALEDSLQQAIDPALAGLFPVPVREQALTAVADAMDFGGLFFGMSFFLIVAAIVLTALLFGFGMEQRSRQMGILAAVGWRSRQTRLALMAEGTVIALLGALAGAAAGTLYTRALLLGLGRYWQGAVASAALYYHAEPATLAIGAATTLVCALGAMALAIRRLFHQTPRDLLHADFSQVAELRPGRMPGRWGWAVPLALFLIALLVILYVLAGDVTDVAPYFFAAGSLFLIAGLGLFRYYLGALVRRQNAERFTLYNLAVLNLSRRPGRSLAVAGVLAAGCFLVFAVSAMQTDIYANATHRESGTGGFAVIAETTFPVLEAADTLIALPEVSHTAIKVRDGDDASCLNLNRAQTPRLLGIDTQAFASRGSFTGETGSEAFWRQLEESLPGGEIPAFVGDANTAMWNLKKKVGREKGDVLLYQDEAGQEVRLRLVATLPVRLSVFQGSLLISQDNFTRLFPSEDGHRMFLLDAAPAQQTAVMAQLHQQFDRFGMEAVPTVKRLEEYAVVESTYLAMFLVLGGLGMVIGSVGMAVVVIRNLVDRRAELAMLAALGFPKGLRRRAYFTEFGLLVLAGLGIGGAAASIALLPALLKSQSTISTQTLLGMSLLLLVSYAACLALALFVPLHRTDFGSLRNE